MTDSFLTQFIWGLFFLTSFTGGWLKSNCSFRWNYFLTSSILFLKTKLSSLLLNSFIWLPRITINYFYVVILPFAFQTNRRTFRFCVSIKNSVDSQGQVLLIDLKLTLLSSYNFKVGIDDNFFRRRRHRKMTSRVKITWVIMINKC